MGIIFYVSPRRRNDATHRKRISKPDGRNHFDKAIVVHSKLGPGLLESVYRTCLTHELRAAGQKVVTERIVPIVYDGIELDGYRLDMLVNDWCNC